MLFRGCVGVTTGRDPFSVTERKERAAVDLFAKHIDRALMAPNKKKKSKQPGKGSATPPRDDSDRELRSRTLPRGEGDPRADDEASTEQQQQALQQAEQPNRQPLQDRPNQTETERLYDERVDRMADDLDRLQAAAAADAAVISAKRAELRTVMAAGPIVAPRPPAVSSSLVVYNAATLAAAAKAAEDDRESMKRRSDQAAAEAARAERNVRLRRIAELLPTVEIAPAGRPPVRPRQTSFAPQAGYESDEVSVLPSPPARALHLNQLAALIKFLTTSVCSSIRDPLPSALPAAHMLAYTASLNTVLAAVRSNLPPNSAYSFTAFVLVMEEVGQFLPPFYAGQPAARAHEASFLLTTWIREFKSQVTRALQLANGNPHYLETHFDGFLVDTNICLIDAYDPVVTLKLLVDGLCKVLANKKSKAMLASMFSAGQQQPVHQQPVQQQQQWQPVQQQPVQQQQQQQWQPMQQQQQQQQQQLGKGSGKGSGGKGAGKGKGGKANQSTQQQTWPAPPGLPDQYWHFALGIYVRNAVDPFGNRIRNSCIRCGYGSAPGATSYHHSGQCQATGAEVTNWVQNKIPVQ